jgi:hypothetical protein
MKRKFPGRKPGSKIVSEEEREGIVADYKTGMLLPDLVVKYKRSKSTIWNTARKAGLPSRRFGEWKQKKTGERGPKKLVHSKFVTDDERAKIAADYATSMTLAVIIAKYGRSKDAILRAVRMAGVPLRGRGGKVIVMKARKKSMKDQMSKRVRQKAKRIAMATSINHANKAFTKAHKSGDVVARAVGVLIKSLESEEIQELFIDFNLRQFKTTRLRVEEGRVA